MKCTENDHVEDTFDTEKYIDPTKAFRFFFYYCHLDSG